jgi:hypothetical protein
VSAGEVSDLLVGEISSPTEDNGFDFHNPNFSHPRQRPQPQTGAVRYVEMRPTEPDFTHAKA